MLRANFKRQVISKHVPRGFSFLYFSATLLSRGLTCAKSMFTRAKTGLCARSIRARNVLYLSYILLTPLERPTVINPNPFNMQISAPPTAWGLHTRFLFFFFPPRTSFNRRCNSYRGRRLRERCHSLCRIRYYLYFPLCRFFSALRSHIMFMYICTVAKYVQR